MSFKTNFPLHHFVILTVFCLSLNSCVRDEYADPIDLELGDVCASSMPVGTDWEFDIPFYFQDPIIPADNPMKEEAIELGRYLFYEKKLSGDNTQACAACHSPANAFSDPAQFSIGIDGIAGTRNSMALVNLAWTNNGFFWDSRAPDLETQILEPVENPIEMHNTWDNAMAQLEDTDLYPPMYEAAFGSTCIDSVRSAKALAQFIRSMVSSTSKWDKSRVGMASLTESELLGQELWDREGGDPELVGGGDFGGDCFHCHPIPSGQFRDNFFHNNGLDSVFTDPGRAGVTGLASDAGLFKVPTLRNIEYTAPYMHDGRFNTLEEVIEHYNTGGHPSATSDVEMLGEFGGLFLSEQSKQALIDFLKALSDPEFINNPAFSDPH